MSSRLENQQTSSLESLLSSWSTVDPPAPTISDLLDELVTLLAHTNIKSNSTAKTLIERCVEQIYCRNGLEPLQGQEQGFYNLSQKLLDSQGKINTWCLGKLQEVQIEISSIKQAAHETTLFKGTKTYKISLEKGYSSQKPGWFLAAHGNLAKDRRDKNSTYAMVIESTSAGNSWHIFSQDNGKTYRIALAVNDYAQKGWELGLCKKYPQDNRNSHSYYCCVQRPLSDEGDAWHLEPENGGKSYKIILATHGNWALAVHRSARDSRSAHSTYAMIHHPGNGWEGHWKIEPE